MKGEINPNPSPQWVKDTIAEIEADSWRETGRVPDGAAIDRRAVEMLERDDARLRNAKPRPAPKKRTRIIDPADAMARESGAAFHRAPVGTTPKPTTETLNPWQAALRARIRRIIMLIPGTRPRDQQFVYPGLANTYVHEFLAWKTCSGKYENLNQRDRDKAFSRATEDLADRSTGVLGPWRVNGV